MRLCRVCGGEGETDDGSGAAAPCDACDGKGMLSVFYHDDMQADFLRAAEEALEHLKKYPPHPDVNGDSAFARDYRTVVGRLDFLVRAVYDVAPDAPDDGEAWVTSRPVELPPREDVLLHRFVAERDFGRGVPLPDVLQAGRAVGMEPKEVERRLRTLAEARRVILSGSVVRAV